MAGRRRAQGVAQRLGVALRDARTAAGMLQADVAASAGLSQARVSDLERGRGAGASLETWACAAAAVGEQLVTFLELAPGATPPRDMEHLRRQAAAIELANRGGWRAHPEFALDPGAIRSRAIDVVLLRLETREAIVVEIWDWFEDVGAALRSLDGKAATIAERLRQRDQGPRLAPWTIRCLFVVRRTRRDERLVSDASAAVRSPIAGQVTSLAAGAVLSDCRHAGYRRPAVVVEIGDARGQSPLTGMPPASSESWSGPLPGSSPCRAQ